MKFIYLLLIPFVSFSQVTGNISLGGEFHSGNYTAYSMNFTANIKNDTSLIKWYVNPTFKYSEKTPLYKDNLIVYEREFYINSGLAYKTDPYNKIFMFSEVENSIIRKIDLRASLGFGYGKYANIGKVKFALSEVILPEYYSSNFYSHNSIRSSTRLKIETNIKGINISSITLFQPAIVTIPYIQWTDNICARSTNTISYNIIPKLLLGFSYIMTYDSYSSNSYKDTNTPVTAKQIMSNFYIKYNF